MLGLCANSEVGDVLLVNAVLVGLAADSLLRLNRENSAARSESCARVARDLLSSESECGPSDCSEREGRGGSARETLSGAALFGTCGEDTRALELSGEVARLAASPACLSVVYNSSSFLFCLSRVSDLQQGSGAYRALELYFSVISAMSR